MTGGNRSASHLGSGSLGAHAPAIVLDGEQRCALAVARSLGQRGIPVWVADSSARPLSSASRFVRKTLRYPDPATCPAPFLAWLEALDSHHPGCVLFPLTDVTVPLVLQASLRIPALRTALPTAAAYEGATDKARLLELAKALGIRAPRTWPVNAANRGGFPCSMNFPVVVKPSRSAKATAGGIRKRSVRYAFSRHELTTVIDALLLDSTDELLVQEYVEGSGIGVFALYDHAKPLLFFSHRRLRERPPTGGVSVLSESTRPPEEGVTAARRLLESLHWHGVAMVEFKSDRLGQLWLMEINARLWGSLQLAVDCGADFPRWLYELAVGSPVDPPRSYDVGRRLRWWLGDLDNLYARLRDPRWTPTSWSKARAIGEFLVPWRSGMRYELLRWRDPAPGLLAFGKYLAALRKSANG